MKKLSISIGLLLSALFPVAASAAPISVDQYEARTKLSSLWENPENKALLLARLTLNHTNLRTAQFYEASFKANKVEIGKYSQSVRCRKGEKSACRVEAAK
jgi:hypothetical protein